MSVGLSPIIFQRLNEILRSKFESNVFVYLDDIIIATFEEHLRHFAEVFC